MYGRTLKKSYYKTLGTSVINSPLSSLITTPQKNGKLIIHVNEHQPILFSGNFVVFVH